MPQVATRVVPEKLRPYLFHGLDLSWSGGRKEAVGDCPFCGRVGKFCVAIDTGHWWCHVCTEQPREGSSPLLAFLHSLWMHSEEATMDYSSLSRDRGLLQPDTLIHWRLARSVINGEWLVPTYSINRKLSQLYRYAVKGGRRLLLATATLGHGLFGLDLFDENRDTIYLCEGPWDAMALWEILGSAKATEAGLATTANPARSLLATANVLAVPGCMVFSEEWLPLFAGKTVNVLYDNDHPGKHPKTGCAVPPAGRQGSRRVAAALGGVARQVNYLRWGKDGYDLELPHGFDVRDLLLEAGSTVDMRLAGLTRLLDKIVPVATDTLHGAQPRAQSPPSGELDCVPCSSYAELVLAWREALRWTAGLDHALTVMLAAVASTKSVGDQLWVKVLGPAACGKSTLCEALSVNRDYVVAKSTIRGFHSGFRTDGREGEDHGLIPLIRDKTLVTKDGDTLLQSPNLSQILSEARDLYDSTARTHYRNATSKDYSGVRMTWLLCGTSSLRSIDSSELGERFLDCVIMEEIDDELEDEILWRVANRADHDMAYQSDSKVETQHAPALCRAMQLTGGYVGYLRKHAAEIIPGIESPDWARRRCTRLGKFVAFMRARPSLRQEETAEREFATRLVSQHVRLAKCLAFVLNRPTVDAVVMDRVRRVTLDTARGQTLRLARYLHREPAGVDVRALSLLTSRSEEKTRTMLRFLRAIGVVEPVEGIRGRARWKLTTRLQRLYTEVMRAGEPADA